MLPSPLARFLADHLLCFFFLVGIEGVGRSQLSSDTGRQLEACCEAHQLGFSQQCVLRVQQPKQFPAAFGIYAIAQALTGGLDGGDELLRLLFVESFLLSFHVVVHGDPSLGSQHTYHNSGRKAITFSRTIFIYSGAFLEMFY